MMHRKRLTAPTLTAGAAALALAVAGCGAKTKDEAATAASGGTPAAGSDVLNIPYLADMSVPDPDVFYDIEGNSVILNTYEGLVKYAPDSTKIVGALADSFTESKDRLTYTFKLKSGVKFHSGAAMTSADVKASFKRRADVGQAPAYMVAPIKSMSTPDPLTFIVKLKSPVDPFMAYMASSWGPKVIGPAALKTNAGKDFGQKWMRTHEDGTGPFTLTAFNRGRQYTLTRNDAYYGTKPFFREVNLKITPDINTQRLELQNGDLDAVLHSFPASELASLPSKLKIQTEPSFLRLLLYVNTNKAPFDDPAVRRALRSTLDVDQLVKQAYSDTATKSVGPYPTALLTGQPVLPYTPDPAAAKAAVAKATTKKISMAYTADESGVQRRVSELLQAQLTAAGFDVTLKEVQLPQTYAYIKDLKHAPDLLLATNTPDAAHPDTWARIMFQSAGGLNFLGYSNKALDKALDDALPATGEQAAALYRKVGQQMIDSDSLFFLGDVKDVFVLSKGLTGVEHVPAYPWTLTYAALKRG
ncbi:MAG: transporter substrate-binding protein [Solirubrobacterales bacterium]|nr:transporter substrate-binding protein [Solirubrobacterales bacterium]